MPADLESVVKEMRSAFAYKGFGFIGHDTGEHPDYKQDDGI
jgi:hypothetical protein